ncbi:MAG TPA: SRPBCC domain-containing protein [Candidatus Acidoferrum sp.]|nr:SRPBCC domain-containing protein [Candidatus Acidoferrum sp.]
MPEKNSSSATQPATREATITRIFDAPRALVFKAWTNPNHMAQWWGPKGFTNRSCELDVRPGGVIRIEMVTPDGTAHPMTGVFHEIVEPERLVFTSRAFFDKDGNPKIEVRNTVTFEDHNGKTKLTVKIVIVRAAPEVERAVAGMEQGWNQSLDRLAQLLANA